MNQQLGAVPITLTQQNPGTLKLPDLYAVNGNTIQAMSNGTSDSCVWVWGDGSSNTYYSSQAAQPIPAMVIMLFSITHTIIVDQQSA